MQIQLFQGPDWCLNSGVVGGLTCLLLRLVEINQCNVGKTLFYLIQIKSTGAIHVHILSKEPFLGHLKAAFCLLGALCSAAPKFCSFTAALGADRCQRELRVPQVIFAWCLTLSFPGDRVALAALVPKAAPECSWFPSGSPTGSSQPGFQALSSCSFLLYPCECQQETRALHSTGAALPLQSPEKFARQLLWVRKQQCFGRILQLKSCSQGSQQAPCASVLTYKTTATEHQQHQV